MCRSIGQNVTFAGIREAAWESKDHRISPENRCVADFTYLCSRSGKATGRKMHIFETGHDRRAALKRNVISHQWHIGLLHRSST